MDADPDNRSILPRYVWVAAAVAVALMAGSVWWASTFRGSVKQPPLGPVPERLPAPVEVARGASSPYIPPTLGYPPSNTLEKPAPRVKITPKSGGDPEPKSVPGEAAPEKPLPPPIVATSPSTEAANDGVRDMFPMGDVLDKHASPAKSAAGPSGPVAPEFDYGGKHWSSTGKFVSAGKLDLEPVDVSLGGRAVYRLANTDPPENVMFVDSDSADGQLAIYRSTTG